MEEDRDDPSQQPGPKRERKGKKPENNGRPELTDEQKAKMQELKKQWVNEQEGTESKPIPTESMDGIGN